MKFILHLGPGVPASEPARAELWPIAQRTERGQQMLAEMIERAQLAEQSSD
jgi:hypothetical protein